MEQGSQMDAARRGEGMALFVRKTKTILRVLKKDSHCAVIISLTYQLSILIWTSIYYHYFK
jgi:hypothetical protein